MLPVFPFPLSVSSGMGSKKLASAEFLSDPTNNSGRISAPGPAFVVFGLLCEVFVFALGSEVVLTGGLVLKSKVKCGPRAKVTFGCERGQVEDKLNFRHLTPEVCPVVYKDRT